MAIVKTTVKTVHIIIIIIMNYIYNIVLQRVFACTFHAHI